MIKNCLRKWVIRRKKKEFEKYAIVGQDIQYSTYSRCWNTGSRENVVIGNHGCIFCFIQALWGGKVFIGDNIYIGSRTIIQSKEHVTIGNNVIISNNVTIVDNNNHPTEPADRLAMSACRDYMTDELWTWKYAASKPIVIEDNVWIGKNAAIMKGVTIGNGSIVAMGAVVTHDVAPCTLVAGNPAKEVKRLKGQGIK